MLGWKFGGGVISGDGDGMLYSFLYWLHSVSNIGFLLFVCMSFNYRQANQIHNKTIKTKNIIIAYKAQNTISNYKKGTKKTTHMIMQEFSN
jgi:hypothetical protein